MTGLTNEAADKSRRMRKTLIAASLGAASGFAATFFFLGMIDGGTLPDLGVSREIAALVAILFLLMGAIIGFGLVTPKYGAKVLNVEDAEEIGEQRSQLLQSAIAVLVSGIVLMVLALSAPVGPIPREIALGVLVLGCAITAYCSHVARKEQDELMREVGKDCSVVALYLMFAVGGLWVALAHLEYVTPPAPIDWLTMFWGLTLLAAFIVTGRRGLLTMR